MTTLYHDSDGSSDEGVIHNIRPSMVKNKQDWKKKSLKPFLKKSNTMERQSSYISTTTTTSNSTQTDPGDPRSDGSIIEEEGRQADDNRSRIQNKSHPPGTPSTIDVNESFDFFDEEKPVNDNNAFLNRLEATSDVPRPEVYDEGVSEGAIELQTSKSPMSDLQGRPASSKLVADSNLAGTSKTATAAETQKASAPPTSEGLVAGNSESSDFSSTSKLSASEPLIPKTNPPDESKASSEQAADEGQISEKSLSDETANGDIDVVAVSLEKESAPSSKKKSTHRSSSSKDRVSSRRKSHSTKDGSSSRRKSRRSSHRTGEGDETNSPRRKSHAEGDGTTSSRRKSRRSSSTNDGEMQSPKRDSKRSSSRRDSKSSTKSPKSHRDSKSKSKSRSSRRRENVPVVPDAADETNDNAFESTRKPDDADTKDDKVATPQATDDAPLLQDAAVETNDHDVGESTARPEDTVDKAIIPQDIPPAAPDVSVETKYDAKESTRKPDDISTKDTQQITTERASSPLSASRMLERIVSGGLANSFTSFVNMTGSGRSIERSSSADAEAEDRSPNAAVPSTTSPRDCDFVTISLNDDNDDAAEATVESVDCASLNSRPGSPKSQQLLYAPGVNSLRNILSMSPTKDLELIPQTKDGDEEAQFAICKSDGLKSDGESSTACDDDFNSNDPDKPNDPLRKETVGTKKKTPKPPERAASKRRSIVMICCTTSFAVVVTIFVLFFMEEIFISSAVIETVAPSVSMAPSSTPSFSQVPSVPPSSNPSLHPTTSVKPTIAPSDQPTLSLFPSLVPTISAAPTPAPSIVPTESLEPSDIPSTVPSATPSLTPSGAPSLGPTVSKAPSSNPSSSPSAAPTTSPSQQPTVTFAPSKSPSRSPTRKPTRFPTPPPTRNPTPRPTPPPTRNPTPRPTPNPTRPPTPRPTPLPTMPPTPQPTREPTPRPTPRPTSADLLNASKIRLYWSIDYFWQETKEETWWCMECVKCAEYGMLDAPDHGCVSYGTGDESKCQAGDSLWIRDCRDRGNRWNIEEVGDGFMMRIATTNLCMERIRDQRPFLYIQNCDRNSSYQRFVLQDDYNKFEMRPVLYRGRSEVDSECVSQLHHPKNGELLALHNCRLNRLYETLYWQRYG